MSSLSDIFDWFMTDNSAFSQARMETCRACLHFESMLERCSKCGCFMKFKTTLPNAECPIGKWKSINRNTQEDSNNGG